jgi:hypothetical protein
MQSKKEGNRERAQLFVQQLLQRSGMSLAQLERALEIGWHGDTMSDRHKSGKAGETLARWLAGRSKKVAMRDVQQNAQAAYAKGLLPPLREGMLRRQDVFFANDQTVNADDAWIKGNSKMRSLEKLQAAAYEAISAFAAALDEDNELLIVDTSIDSEAEGRSCEIAAVRYARLHIDLSA